MSDNELTNPSAKPPAPTEHAASWAGRVVAHKDHGPDLDAAAAIHEFHDHLPRAEAEEKAYKDYVKSQHTEAAAHHLLGMKAAAAGGDMESARKHGLMYELHSKALGHESVGPAHPSVQAHMEKNPGKVKFKPHRGDLFALDKKEEAVTKSELMHALYETLVKASDSDPDGENFALQHTDAEGKTRTLPVRHKTHATAKVHAAVRAHKYGGHVDVVDIREPGKVLSTHPVVKKSEPELQKVAPPGFSEATMHKLKREHGVEAAFKIAWAAHNKATKKAEKTERPPAKCKDCGEKILNRDSGIALYCDRCSDKKMQEEDDKREGVADWAKAELEAKKTTHLYGGDRSTGTTSPYSFPFSSCGKNLGAGKRGVNEKHTKDRSQVTCKDCLAEKAELAPTKRDRAGRVVPCVCPAYPWGPHRYGGGKCKAGR